MDEAKLEASLEAELSERWQRLFESHRPEQRQGGATQPTAAGPALIAYLCAGDPSVAAMPVLLDALVAGGVDVIELGMPFSDPTADGATIQRASERSLRAGTRLEDLFDIARAFSAKHTTPLVLFGYFNPILAYGVTRFVKDAAESGVAGLLVVDLPADESETLFAEASAAGLGLVPIVAPTSQPGRIAIAGKLASAFIYYVSMTGVTGGKVASLSEAATRAAAVEAQTGKPVCLGFGVKTPEDVTTVAPHVSGVIVGSALVETVAAAPTPEAAATALTTQVRALKAACRPS